MLCNATNSFSTRCTCTAAIRSQLSSKKSTINVHKAQKFSLENRIILSDLYFIISLWLIKYDCNFVVNVTYMQILLIIYI